LQFVRRTPACAADFRTKASANRDNRC